MNTVIVEKWLPSRARTAPVTTIVFHGTAGATANSSIDWLRFIGLSYHYIIERDGTVFKCVPTSRQALHAGVSVGPDGSNVNRYSIGVCFANREDGREPITDAQLQSAAELCREIVRAIPTIKWITTHKAIAPRRKSDPRMFNITAFARLLRLDSVKIWAREVL
jgi:N-acetylmuramoyl-L-alanine amidase